MWYRLLVRAGRRPPWLAVLAVVLAGAFLCATTAAVVIHHHNSAASEANCPICHLNHQVAMRPLAAHALPVPLRCGGKTSAREFRIRQIPLYSLVPTRAPPAA